jgi:hypothetical protein
MNGWTSEELNKIGTAEELRIRSLRRDGTLRNLTTIWVVRYGEDLYVRPVNGRTSAWFRGNAGPPRRPHPVRRRRQRRHLHLCRGR